MNKDKIKIILKDKVNYIENENSEEVIDKFVTELLDLNINNVYPLNETDTLYLRRIFYIVDGKVTWNQLIRMSSYILIILGEYFTNNITINSSINALFLPKRISNLLFRNEIYTIFELIKYRKEELSTKYHLSDNTIFIIEKRLEELGFFLGMYLNEDYLENDISILNLKIRTYHTLKKHGINTLNELINLSYHNFNIIPYLGTIGQEDVLNKLHELNLKMKFEEEKDILQMELWELFPTKIVNILYHKNIYKIKDLIEYKISDLEKVHYLKNYIKFIVDIVHRYGLNFQDEITEEQRLENYQKYIESLGSIVEEKSNVRKLKQ